jgi:hypothetical protein
MITQGTNILRGRLEVAPSRLPPKIKSYCNVLSQGHRCATATIEIVEPPQWQTLATTLRWVTTTQAKHVTIIYKERFRSNGLQKTWDRCPVSGSEKTYLSPRSETRRRSGGQRQNNGANGQRQSNRFVDRTSGIIVKCDCRIEGQ